MQTAQHQFDPLELNEKDVYKFAESATRAADVPQLEKNRTPDEIRKYVQKEVC